MRIKHKAVLGKKVMGWFSLFLIFWCGAVGIADSAYVYKGDKYTDPFIPVMVRSGKGIDNYENIVNLIPMAYLKGIFSYAKGRMAVISTPDGASFIAKDGKLFDPSRKPVDGIATIVKVRSAVLITRDKTVYELSLPETYREVQ